jgi:hypothetical protein
MIPAMPQAPLLPVAVEPGRYRHFKGGEYEVLSVGRHTETDELVVVYVSVADPKTMWVRPLERFIDEVEVGDDRLPRFAISTGPPRYVVLIQRARSAVTAFARKWTHSRRLRPSRAAVRRNRVPDQRLARRR